MKTEKEFLESVYRKYNAVKIKKARRRKTFASAALAFIICAVSCFAFIFQKEKMPEVTVSEDFFESCETSEDFFSEEDTSGEFVSEFISESVSDEFSENDNSSEDSSEDSKNFLENERVVYSEKFFFGASSDFSVEKEEAEMGVSYVDMDYFFEQEEFDGVYYFVGIKAIMNSTQENIECVQENGVEAFRKKTVLELKEHFESVGLFVQYMEEFDLFLTYIKEDDLDKLSTENSSLLVYHLPYNFKDASDGLFE